GANMSDDKHNILFITARLAIIEHELEEQMLAIQGLNPKDIDSIEPLAPAFKGLVDHALRFKAVIKPDLYSRALGNLLAHAVRLGDMESVQRLLDAGTDVNKTANWAYSHGTVWPI